MAKIYAQRIKDGKMTINDVPARWREDVKALMKEDK